MADGANDLEGPLTAFRIADRHILGRGEGQARRKQQSEYRVQILWTIQCIGMIDVRQDRLRWTGSKNLR